MTRRPLLLAAAFALSVPALVAQTTPRPSPADGAIAVEINGSIEESALRTAAPEVILTTKGMDKLAKDWNLKGLPNIDFKTNLVVVATSPGGRLSMGPPRLDEAGDLKLVLNETKEVAPGFRYAIRAVPRAGIKTVNGKPLPTE